MRSEVLKSLQSIINVFKTFETALSRFVFSKRERGDYGKDGVFWGDCFLCKKIFEPFGQIPSHMNKSREKDIGFDLIKDVSRGDEAAFRQLYDQTYGRVTFYLQRLVSDESIIEDILVETYAAVWKGARRFKGKSRVTTWIIGIARNLAMKEIKKRKVHANLDDYPNLPNGSSPDPELFDRPALIKNAMSKLAPKHREVLDLVFFHEMTYPEVAKLLDVPVNTVKTRVFYAKDALRETFKHMGVKEDDL
jgi:RNA polymerase sigma-70 factor (ECF subfamily)